MSEILILPEIKLLQIAIVRELTCESKIRNLSSSAVILKGLSKDVFRYTRALKNWF
jgi:hypothetical protein